MLDYHEIGKNVRYYRLKAGLLQKELGEQADTTGDNISHIERCTTKLSLEVLVAIAEVLDVDVNTLLGKCANAWKVQEVDEQLAEVISRLSLEKRQICLILCEAIANAPELK